MILAPRRPRTEVPGAILFQPLTSGTPVASTIDASSSQGQTGKAGGHPASLPTVWVSDGLGTGISGVTVTFAVSGGGGSGTGLSQVTDTNGFATVGGWTLGTTGLQTMTATSAGLTGSPVTFSVYLTGARSVARIVTALGHH